MMMMTTFEALVDELNCFSTAPSAIERLFHSTEEDPEDCAERERLLLRLLRTQNAPPTATIDDVIGSSSSSPPDQDDEQQHVITGDMVLLVMGKPALLFATSIYDEDLTTLIWRGLLRLHERYPALDLLRQVMDNTRDGHGFSALHYAIEAQMDAFFHEVTGWLATANPERLHQAIVHTRTQDVVLPVSKTQMSGKSIASGGCTLAHLAAAKGELHMLQSLLESPVGLDVEAVGGNWDGHSVVELAMLHRRHDVLSYLQDKRPHHPMPSWDAATIALHQNARNQIAVDRYTRGMIAKPPMTRKEVFPALWSRDVCCKVLGVLEGVTKRLGWSKQRHTSYPTTDIPSYQVASIDSWVRQSIQDRLFTQIYERYEISPSKVLTFRELFYVKYDAQHGEQAELPLHCDGSVLSFNILLNVREEFEGGGTYFEADDVTVHITQGDAVVHSGKIRHAGAPVTRGRRIILVGFLDLVNRVGF